VDVFGVVGNAVDLPDDSPLMKVRVPAARARGIPSEDLMRLVAARFESPERGIDRYDALLAHLNCKSDVPATVREHLRELQEVRNVVVHRGGLADERLRRIARTFSPSIDQPLHLDREQISSYVNAISAWIEGVEARVRSLCEG